MNWKGWVESRIRLLTLKIERGVLLCHPYPGEFSDKSKPFHHSYFMGLRRKQGSNPQEGVEFNIRRTVKVFKDDVYLYSSWKETMWIDVCHVKRKHIPSFVFPGGVRRSPPVRSSVQRSPGSNSPQPDNAVAGRRKRKQQDEVNRTVTLTDSSSTGISEAISLNDSIVRRKLEPCHFSDNTSYVGFSGNGKSQPIEQSFAQTVNHSEEVDGLVELKSEIQHNGDIEGDETSVFVATEKAVGLATAGVGTTCSFMQQKCDLEELEPLELSVTTATVPTSSNMPTQKPLIRFSFTSLTKATGNSA